MFLDPGSPNQQMIQCTRINNMKMSGYSYRPDNQVKINLAEEGCNVSTIRHLD